jgi:hypothetical protein
MTRKPAAPKAPPKPPIEKVEPKYKMSIEVYEWIDRAQSIITYQKSEIADLKAEVKELKAYKAWASKRLTESERD